MPMLDDLLRAIQAHFAKSKEYNPKEAEADYYLNKSNSLMGSHKEGERATRQAQGPLMATVMEMLKTGGMDPTNAPGGGGGVGGNEAGIYRLLGLERQSGSLNPADFAKAIMNQPNYPRYKQLVENIARKTLGDKFSGYRGAAVGDPLMNVVSKGGLPSATAISLDERVARQFAQGAADSGLAGRIAQGEFTPESVLGLLPRRNTGYGSEKELIVDPRWAENLKTTGRAVPPDKLNPFVEFKPEGDLLLNEAMKAAMEKFGGGRRPIPGSPSQSSTESKYSGLDELVSKLMNKSEKPTTLMPKPKEVPYEFDPVGWAIDEGL